MAATQEISPERTQYSLFHGPSDPPLVTLSLGDLLDLQCQHYGDRECIVTPWTGSRWTYHQLQQHSSQLARYLLSRGIQPGDRIAVLAGNHAEYASVFFACMRMGAILVILNNTYTTSEAEYALQYTESRVLFATPFIGRQDNRAMLRRFGDSAETLPDLQEIVTLDGSGEGGYVDYQHAVHVGAQLPEGPLIDIQRTINPYETCNLQFTSGSTGHPKAAMLTHYGLLNNARFIGDRMRLTSEDVLCCPPPLFHCFGLVLGLLACVTHGASTVYPSEGFDGPATLHAISAERCTALHGVPAMFDTLFSLPRPALFDCSRLRTGIIAGAPVPRPLMERLVHDFGMHKFTSSYGLTEASPTCFNASTHDPLEHRLHTVGTLLPHAHAKIVDRNGHIVPIGQRGELCIAGYQLQRGYWNNPTQTAASMRRDAEGTLWLHTGDEAVFHRDGSCTITGRFKDIIIRGGENIYPLEIEERLSAHPALARAVVVGVPHARYQEVPVAFVQRAEGAERVGDEAVREWTRETLGRQKAPVHVLWLGEGEGIPDEVPVMGSGKVKKFELRRVAEELLAHAGGEVSRARL